MVDIIKKENLENEVDILMKEILEYEIKSINTDIIKTLLTRIHIALNALRTNKLWDIRQKKDYLKPLFDHLANSLSKGGTLEALEGDKINDFKGGWLIAYFARIDNYFFQIFFEYDIYNKLRPPTVAYLINALSILSYTYYIRHRGEDKEKNIAHFNLLINTVQSLRNGDVFYPAAGYWAIASTLYLMKRLFNEKITVKHKYKRNPKPYITQSEEEDFWYECEAEESKK